VEEEKAQSHKQRQKSDRFRKGGERTKYTIPTRKRHKALAALHRGSITLIGYLAHAITKKKRSALLTERRMIETRYRAQVETENKTQERGGLGWVNSQKEGGGNRANRKKNSKVTGRAGCKERAQRRRG